MAEPETTALDEVGELRRELAARDKVIAVLLERVVAVQSSSPFGLTLQNAALVAVVERKTAELESKQDQLADTLERLQRTQSELLQEQKLTAIGQLAAGIAHELNTPSQYVADNVRFVRSAWDQVMLALDACRLVVRAASGGTIDPGEVAAAERGLTAGRMDYQLREVPKAIDQCLEGLDRMSTIVAAMKSFAPRAGEVADDVDINEALQTTITLARGEWKYVAEMVTELDPELPRLVGRREDINQLFLGLIVNASDAIQSRGQPGTIRVTTSHADGWTEIRIADTGCGIPEAVRDRVFEPFFTTKPVGQGTGQGLHMAYQIVVDRHGGSISFDSDLTTGTTFIVRLPLLAPAAPVSSP